MQNTQEVWLIYNALLLSLLIQTKGFFCFSFNKRSQKHAATKTWAFEQHMYPIERIAALASTFLNVKIKQGQCIV